MTLRWHNLNGLKRLTPDFHKITQDQLAIRHTEYRKTFLKRYAEDISELLVTARTRVESKADETQKNLEQLKELLSKLQSATKLLDIVLK